MHRPKRGPGDSIMTGRVKVLCDGFGFIQSDGGTLYFFRYEHSKGRPPAGARVNFDKHDPSFDQRLNQGRFKDVDLNHRRPSEDQRYRRTNSHDTKRAPRAYNILVIVEP